MNVKNLMKWTAIACYNEIKKIVILFGLIATLVFMGSVYEW